jgi:hypothetical protein
MPQAGFEPVVKAINRPQTLACERSATGTGGLYYQSLILLLVKTIHFGRYTTLFQFKSTNCTSLKAESRDAGDLKN